MIKIICEIEQRMNKIIQSNIIDLANNDNGNDNSNCDLLWYNKKMAM